MGIVYHVEIKNIRRTETHGIVEVNYVFSFGRRPSAFDTQDRFYSPREAHGGTSMVAVHDVKNEVDLAKCVREKVNTDIIAFRKELERDRMFDVVSTLKWESEIKD